MYNFSDTRESTFYRTVRSICTAKAVTISQKVSCMVIWYTKFGSELTFENLYYVLQNCALNLYRQGTNSQIPAHY